VRAASNDFLGTVVCKCLCALRNRACGVDHVVEHKAGLALDVADDVHYFHHVCLGTAFIYDCEGRIELACHCAAAGNTAYVGAYHDEVVVFVKPLLFEILCQKGHTHQVVHRHIEETLQLAAVQVHCQYAVCACRLQNVRNQFSRNGVTCAGLAVLASVAEVRNYRRNTSGRSALQGVDDDKQFHKVVVYRTACGLHHKHVAAADGFLDVDGSFTVAEFSYFDFAELQVQLLANLFRQLNAGVACKNLDCTVRLIQHDYPFDDSKYFRASLARLSRKPERLYTSPLSYFVVTLF